MSSYSIRSRSKACASGFLCAFFATLTAIAFVVSLTGDHRRAEACGGSPPPPFCAKTVSIGKAVPGVILGSTTVPTTVTLPTVVVLGVNSFPPGSGACPPPPYIATVTLTLTCAPPPGATGSVTVPILPGTNVVPVPVVIPPGPPRACTVAGTVSVAFTDGTTVSNTGDTTLCIAEPSPADPSKPRLDLQHADPGATIARVHPGDQAEHYYLITNNDPTESFEGTVVVQSASSSRQPTLTGPPIPGSGVYSVSDPQQGDDFPIAFLDELGENGCVPLPPDPQNTIRPTIERRIELAPGEMTVIAVATRPWGMCADGSCSEQTVMLRGSFSDGTEGLACAGAVVLADTSVAPGYRCGDSGAATQITTRPGSPALAIHGQPTVDPTSAWSVDVELVSLSLRGQELLAVEQQSFASSYLCPEPGSDLCRDRPSDYGRNRVLALPADLLRPGQPIGITLEYELRPGPDSPPIEIEVFDMMTVPGAPHGHAHEGPLGMGIARIGGGDFMVDSFFDVFFQVSGQSIGADGSLQPLQFEVLDLTPTPGGFIANIIAFIILSAEPAVGVSLDGDFRGYARAGDAPARFRRGDANADFDYNIGDPVFLLAWLFRNGAQPPCLKAADENDDGALNLADVVYALWNIFLGGPNPPAPFPRCGEDPTPDNLSCERFDRCRVLEADR